jgi:hypothetical protein
MDCPCFDTLLIAFSMPGGNNVSKQEVTIPEIFTV